MKVVQANVLKGFRVPVGDKFLTVYPNLNASVKDTKNDDGTVKEVATAKMLTANKGKSRLGASVSVKFFASKAAEPSAVRSSLARSAGRKLTSARVPLSRTRTSLMVEQAEATALLMKNRVLSLRPASLV